MPSTSVGVVHVNAPLTNLARLYRPSEDGFVADQICPPLPVVKESDLYYVWDQAAFFGTETSDLVPDRSEPREVEYQATTASYQTQRRELAWSISDRERANADSQLRLEQNLQRGTLGRLLLLHEQRVAALLQDSSVTSTVGGESFTGGLDSTATAAKTAFWDGAATTYQNIFTDVVKGIAFIRKSIGIRPNTIVIPAAVAEGLHKSKFFDGTAPQPWYATAPADSPLFIQYPLLSPVLWGLRVVVPGQITNTAKEGQTASYSDIFGETVRILYVTPGPALEIPSCAYTFVSEQTTTRQERVDRRRIDWFAVGHSVQAKVVAPFAGYSITDTLT